MMRTPLFLLVGLLLLAACALLGRLFSSNYPSATYAATVSFITLWLVISAANLWVGVNKAGYTVTEEFPIFLLIFIVPTAIALLLKWKFL
jgi:hypothetical protein